MTILNPSRVELALPFEVLTLGVVAYVVVAWTRKTKGGNRDQHSRDQRAQSGGLWSGDLDLNRGANRDQHSRDQRGHWFFKGWGTVMIPHRPILKAQAGPNGSNRGKSVTLGSRHKDDDSEITYWYHESNVKIASMYLEGDALDLFA
nr:hypothetical protein [Tanacetum cinerariifolium]